MPLVFILKKIGKTSRNSSVYLISFIVGILLFMPYIGYANGVLYEMSGNFFLLFAILSYVLILLIQIIFYFKCKARENRFFLAINRSIIPKENIIHYDSVSKALTGIPSFTHSYDSDIVYLLNVGVSKGLIPHGCSVQITYRENNNLVDEFHSEKGISKNISMAEQQKNQNQHENAQKKWGFINTKGKIVVPFTYDDVYGFSDGLAAVKQNEKYGFINTKGEVVIPFDYDDAWPFKDGLAVVKQNEKYGFINTEGEVVIPFDYDGARLFKDGLAVVKQNEKYGFINPKGEVVINFVYDSCDNFSDGLAKVLLNKKCFYINTNGEVVIPYTYDYCGDFNDGLAVVKQNEKYGFINTKGEVVIPFAYESCLEFNDGLAAVAIK